MKLLDLYCGAGGAAMGYHRAGFEVVGVDVSPQPRYPFDFVQADALELLTWAGPWLERFDAIHASPPCQKYSSAGLAAAATYGRDYPDLYAATRALCEAQPLPWVIENVTAAPSRSGVVLCGSMFGLPIKRHRTFESSELLLAPAHCAHRPDAITITGHMPQQWLGGKRRPVPRATYEAAMGIDWMRVRELVQSIPPVYTETIGRQLLASCGGNRGQ